MDGTWSELLQMLKNGEIDLMSNVSYSEERTEEMLFSSLPMGTESYYVFVSPDNQEITSENIASLSGKRIGVTKGSIQKAYFLEWAATHQIDADVIEMSCTDEESLQLLGSQIDAFVTMDVYGSQETAIPVCKIGSSDFYFAVSKERPDLLNELDATLNKIQDENKYFDQQLHDKYLKSTETDKYLGTLEREWLSGHDTIRIGYQDNYLAFCAQDPDTGELTGALKDYLDYASNAFENAHLSTVYTGVEMDYCFAVREGDTELYAILAAITNVVPHAAVHTALTYYSTEDVKTSVIELIKDNLFIVMTAISVILLIILILLLRNIRAEKRVEEEKKLVKTLNRRVFVDALTSVRNKGAYTEYIQKLQERVDQEGLTDFAIGIFDCNHLKLINDQHGHDKGDLYLKAACQLICKVFDHSPVFRIGGDEFAVILQNNDFTNRKELIRLFEERRKAICDAAKSKWEEVHIAIGIAVYDAKLDSSVSDTAKRADSIMYENKRKEKAQRC